MADSPALAVVRNWKPPAYPILGKPEVQFHPPRRWRFDLAWPELMVAFECEGGIWVSGRHTRGKGFEADCEKYSVAAALGWSVVRASVGQIEKGTALEWLDQTIKHRLDSTHQPPPGLGFWYRLLG
jgi:hypothetical protein